MHQVKRIMIKDNELEIMYIIKVYFKFLIFI